MRATNLGVRSGLTRERYPAGSRWNPTAQRTLVARTTRGSRTRRSGMWRWGSPVRRGAWSPTRTTAWAPRGPTYRPRALRGRSCRDEAVLHLPAALVAPVRGDGHGIDI